ncbi:hypothetical protein PAECIP111891_02400 [Paenibacillus allorhizoplanae]|uniref:DUF3990 domain-containing protein n=1 Tax=Paenibacillus allorhizoplanae TaxID=2905648 RepID=A0ABN8G9T2_9BACL|nr:DUF3990 domain-containing protein [Paenibacillus allorhizoplanae]CAH1203710.1 hypothetical protein PAECIP111891_02400 [Paenibacillus allorhizoplanae]
MDIITPQRLYHGTTNNLVNLFQDKLLDSRYWRPGRDFGEGFYTTISTAQARNWARKAAARSIMGHELACVLEIELISIPAKMEPLIFLSDSLAWAQFVMSHRSVMNKGEDDPCHKHPDIIIGPMADGDTGRIIEEAVQLNKDVHWFYDQILRTTRGRKLDALRLGNQVVFSSEKWEASLRFVGYNIFTGGRWIYYENTSSAESV